MNMVQYSKQKLINQSKQDGSANIQTESTQDSDVNCLFDRVEQNFQNILHSQMLIRWQNNQHLESLDLLKEENERLKLCIQSLKDDRSNLQISKDLKLKERKVRSKRKEIRSLRKQIEQLRKNIVDLEQKYKRELEIIQVVHNQESQKMVQQLRQIKEQCVNCHTISKKYKISWANNEKLIMRLVTNKQKLNQMAIENRNLKTKILYFQQQTYDSLNIQSKISIKGHLERLYKQFIGQVKQCRKGDQIFYGINSDCFSSIQSKLNQLIYKLKEDLDQQENQGIKHKEELNAQVNRSGARCMTGQQIKSLKDFKKVGTRLFSCGVQFVRDKDL